MGGLDPDGSVISDVELIDLSGRGLECQRPSGPSSVGWGYSSLKTQEGNPLVCGGEITVPNTIDGLTHCFNYDPINDAWEAGAETINERFFSPTAEISQGKYMILGEGFRLSTSEPLHYDFNTEIYQNGIFTLGPDLPEPFTFFLQRPCAAKISEDKTFYSDGYTSMIYDWSSSSWTNPRGLDYSRIVQCGYARKANGDEMIVVVGEHGDHTQVLDLFNNEWRFLEKTHAPFWSAYGERVQMEDTFLLTGGLTHPNTTRNIIEFAPDEEKWIVRKEEMS